ncbi:MAG TPA: VOC family protein [Streptomyces sp.]|nr:VOC family protein [Streptomyces sp.]
MQKITTHLWFDNQAEEAVAHYTSVFPDSRVIDVQRYGEAGPGEAGTVMTITFELAGQRYIALNGGPEFTFNEAVSLYVDCADQEEVDKYWSKLGEGGQEGPCGWLRDKYGLSWQIVPRALTDLLRDPDPLKSAQVMKAMLGMRKLDVKGLEDAYKQ